MLPGHLELHDSLGFFTISYITVSTSMSSLSTITPASRNSAPIREEDTRASWRRHRRRLQGLALLLRTMTTTSRWSTLATCRLTTATRHTKRFCAHRARIGSLGSGAVACIASSTSANSLMHCRAASRSRACALTKPMACVRANSTALCRSKTGRTHLRSFRSRRCGSRCRTTRSGKRAATRNSHSSRQTSLSFKAACTCRPRCSQSGSLHHTPVHTRRIRSCCRCSRTGARPTHSR